MDVFLARQLQISRIQVRRLLRSGRVRLCGRDVSLRAKGAALCAGDEVEVHDFVHPGNALPLPEPDTDLRILERGAGWLAVEKPSGVAVHPLEPDERGTLLGAVLARCPEIAGIGEGGLRSGVVHRLDVDTSGVVLFASEEGRWRALREAFVDSKVEKIYRANVAGVAPERGSCALWLRVAQHRPALVRVVSAQTRGARLTRMGFERIALADGVSALDIRLETGFLHQIRASLAHLGFPVLGDDRYGNASGADAPRLMLHAQRIAIDEIRVTSALPAGFE